MPLSSKDIDHIFQRLRDGAVPLRGLEAFAVGIRKQQGEFERLFGLLGQGEGIAKFLRGDYGCGKTFTAQLAVLEARRLGFVTSTVVVSDNDLHLYRFQDLYSRITSELATDLCPRGAFSDILDRWIARIENALIDGGADENAPDFDDKVMARLKDDLQTQMGGQAPEDFIRTIHKIFELKQKGEVGSANALLSWLCGSRNVDAGIKRLANIKGEIGSRDALKYLLGVLEIVKAAGFEGLVVVVDEVETILRSRKDTRHKSLNGIRQIVDNVADFPGLMWVFTGTVEFFDDRRGVKGLTPLHDRIRFIEQNGLANPRQPQLKLEPFNADRLREVALRLREIYPAKDRARFEERISATVIDRLVDSVTAGFAGDVGIVPREFLREFVNQCDLVDDNEDYRPTGDFDADSSGASPSTPDGDPHDESSDDIIAVTDVW